MTLGGGGAAVVSPCDKLPTLLLEVLKRDFLVLALFDVAALLLDAVSLVTRFEKSSGTAVLLCLAMFSSVRG